MSPLKIALSKGRQSKKAIELFEQVGMDCSDVKQPGRRLIVPLDGGKYQVVLAKAPDVVTYVERGVVDVGIVGKDVILEQENSSYEVLDLGFGVCRFVLAVPEGVDFFHTYKRRRVATKYPNITAKYFADRGMDVELIKIEGSVELSPLLGLADGIVDIVETGETLRANGLREIDEIISVSARVIVNPASMKTRKSEVNALLEKINL